MIDDAFDQINPAYATIQNPGAIGSAGLTLAGSITYARRFSSAVLERKLGSRALQPRRSGLSDSEAGQTTDRAYLAILYVLNERRAKVEAAHRGSLVDENEEVEGYQWSAANYTVVPIAAPEEDRPF